MRRVETQRKNKKESSFFLRWKITVDFRPGFGAEWLKERGEGVKRRRVWHVDVRTSGTRQSRRDPAHCWRLRRLPSFTKLRDPCVYGIHHWGRRIHAASRYLHFHPPTHYRRHIANLWEESLRRKRTVSLRLSSTYDAHVLSSLLERMFSIRSILSR